MRVTMARAVVVRDLRFCIAASGQQAEKADYNERTEQFGSHIVDSTVVRSRINRAKLAAREPRPVFISSG